MIVMRYSFMIFLLNFKYKLSFQSRYKSALSFLTIKIYIAGVTQSVLLLLLCNVIMVSIVNHTKGKLSVRPCRGEMNCYKNVRITQAEELMSMDEKNIKCNTVMPTEYSKMATPNDFVSGIKLNSLTDIVLRNNLRNIEDANPKIVYGKEEIVTKRTTLQKFYERKKIFVTGGTGFMGKIIVDKLLRSCNGVETIYLLIRQKKGKDVHSRVEEIFDDPIFDRLKSEKPKFRHKIVAVPGDCSVAGLGLSLSDKEMLMSKVDLVFHAAATVRFDEKLRTALAINVHGIRDMMALCRNMRNLMALIHVSTAYSNCNQGYVEEKFYPFAVNQEELEALVDKLDDEQLDKILPEILGSWPNTYTFTKAIAENMIRQKSEGLNMGIFRPAIVTSTASEPIEGWIDNFYGPTGVLYGIGTGALRTLHCDGNVNANMVPVDLCVNALLTSAWEVANIASERQGDDMLIYNYVSDTENPINWQNLYDMNFENGLTHPFSDAMWYMCFHMNKSVAINKLYMVFLHFIPAIFLDCFALCAGKKTRFLQIYKKIHKFSNVLDYFCTTNIRYSNSNVQALWNKLEKNDQEMFNFSIANLDWKNYFKNYIHGMRKHLIKEQDITLESARRKWKRLYYLHQVLKLVLMSSFIYICCKIISSLL